MEYLSINLTKHVEDIHGGKLQNSDERYQRRTKKKMERYTMFMNRKTQHCLDAFSSNLSIFNRILIKNPSKLLCRY